MRKVIVRILFIAISTTFCLIFGSCNVSKKNTEKSLEKDENMLDEELLQFVDGYQAADYDTYNQPAKINGLKFEKVYVVGKYDGEGFEDAGNLSLHLIDAKQRKWHLRMDAVKADNKQVYDSFNRN